MHRTFLGVSARSATRFTHVALVLLLTSSVLAVAGCSSVAGGAADSSAIPQLGVDALMLDPGAYTGKIAVTGVVVDVSPDVSGVTLVDVLEFETCGLNPCGGTGMLPLFLPSDGEPSFSGDFYDGQLPELEDTVVVVGAVRSGDMGLYFDVERVTRGSSTILEKR